MVVVPRQPVQRQHRQSFARNPLRRWISNLGIDYASDIRQAREVLLEIAMIRARAPGAGGTG